MSRRGLTLVDVSLREIGEASGFAFDAAEAATIAQELSRSLVDIVEIGYVRPAEWGGRPTPRSCPPEYCAAVREALGACRMAAFIHLGDVVDGFLPELQHLGIDLVRVAVPPSGAAALIARSGDLHAMGIDFTVNVTRMTSYSADQLVEIGRAAQRLGATAFYVADSNGSLLPDRFAATAAALRSGLSIPLGAHLHDNLSLAFANALVAISNGFDWIDGSLAGVGKGGGNLATERIALHLALHHRRAFDLQRLADTGASWAQDIVRPSARFWAAVNGALDIDQTTAGELDATPLHQRLERYSAEYGLDIGLETPCPR